MQEELFQVPIQIKLGEIRLAVTPNAMQLHVNVGLDFDTVTIGIAYDEPFVIDTASVNLLNKLPASKVIGLGGLEQVVKLLQGKLDKVARSVTHRQQTQHPLFVFYYDTVLWSAELKYVTVRGVQETGVVTRGPERIPE